ncbi:glycosyltransferase family 1 protein [uncultured Aquitalea sp.]|uniref:glycosyltransferase family 4 protein n=1 Tax=uncultured Aquitalea sp. TaxID=540272 RepID=UPI0025EA488A|nr:glycosyltransferase family 1 protein [uncultured Aquitalea sp.]
MRVGLDYRPVTAAPYSGIARQVLAMESALAARPGVEVLRFTACPDGHPHRQIALCPAQASPQGGLHRPQERWRFEAGFLPQALRDSRADVYIATANTGLPPLGAPEGVRLGLLLHDVFQLTLDNRHASWWKALAYRQIDRLGVRRSVSLAERVFTPSRFTAEQAAALFPRHAAKLRVLPNAVPSIAEPVMASPLNAPYWLLVGSREPRKNIPWFIEQWRSARQACPELLPELALVGSLDDLPPEQRDLPGLRVLSGVSDAELAALYRHAERLWQPSLAEGFGLPVVEAMAQGTPTAVALGSALDEVALPEAPRFDPHQGAALQRLMRRLAQDGRGRLESPVALRAWAAQFDMPAYSARLWQWLGEWLGEAW